MKFITACLTLKIIAISTLLTTKVYSDNKVLEAYYNQKAMQYAFNIPINNNKKGK